MTLRNSSRASFKSCIRLRSRALMLNRTALPWRFFRDEPPAGLLTVNPPPATDGIPVIPPKPMTVWWWCDGPILPLPPPDVSPSDRLLWCSKPPSSGWKCSSSLPARTKHNFLGGFIKNGLKQKQTKHQEKPTQSTYGWGREKFNYVDGAFSKSHELN